MNFTEVKETYRRYVAAFITGAYAQGWRLPGRPSRCGNPSKTDTPETFALRAHNFAAAMVAHEAAFEPYLTQPYLTQIPPREPEDDDEFAFVDPASYSES